MAKVEKAQAICKKRVENGGNDDDDDDDDDEGNLNSFQ
jgi:hypothetical protein